MKKVPANLITVLTATKPCQKELETSGTERTDARKKF